ncbi:hypothetical protein N7457_000779 [Penicillium paradoxum]|uniref:uncharacterized protein n=1 Tax=Penicillium paradoxum TaxID=176176 RepID=UPI0025481C03|nr:uncharacterized protein N7457_000779 [Penicillium paradoxum]KAJ5794180.1 hypothetical protein N7457_000779 [Penicillium paradoxum]
MADFTPSTERKCHTCRKDETATDRLKHCARCMSTTILYCSRECQKADYRVHKQTCTTKTQSTAATEASVAETSIETSPKQKALQVNIEQPFYQLEAGKWLCDRPEEDVYKLLIDAYRLRLDDDYKFGGIADRDSIYGGANHGKMGFTRFLRLIEQKRGLLPDWWSPSKATECVRYGSSVDPSFNLRWWSDLANAITKSDVAEHYEDLFMPIQLRLFAEEVYGRGAGGLPKISSMLQSLTLSGHL